MGLRLTLISLIYISHFSLNIIIIIIIIIISKFLSHLMGLQLVLLEIDTSCTFGIDLKSQLLLLFSFFCYYSWVSLHFFVLFIGLMHFSCAFSIGLKNQLLLLFNLFLLLFICPVALFGIIHESYCIIFATF